VTPEFRLLLPFCAAVLAVPALAQPAAPEAAPPAPASGETGEDAGADSEEIVVTAGRPRGSVIGDVPPEIQLGPQDIRALGVSTIGEVLAELGGNVASARGRGGGGGPVVLLNGRRIAGFAEIRNLPPEALLRVDVLPEEVALKYGYAADQRVINFVLRPRFKAYTGEFDIGGPLRGNRTSTEAELNYLRIRDDVRLSVEGKVNLDTRLLESDRGIVPPPLAQPFDLAGNITAATQGGEIDPALSVAFGQPVTVAAVPAGAAQAAPVLQAFVPGANAANVTDITQARTLLPGNRALSLAGSYARPVFGNVAATISGGLTSTRTTGLLGLPGVSLAIPAGSPFSPFGSDVVLSRYGPAALEQVNDNWTGRAALTLNGTVAAWQWTMTANYNHDETDVVTDRGIDTAAAQARILANDAGLNPYGPEALAGALRQDLSRSVRNAGDANLLANGTLFALPAGSVATSFRAGVQSVRLDANSQRAGLVQSSRLSRSQGNFQGNFDLPLTSRRNDVLAAVGDLSANFNIAVDTLSDFGTLTTTGYGLTWKPDSRMTFIVSVTDQQGPPSLQQLGNPQILTPNIRVFDFRTGETAVISRLDGGNPDLLADNRRVFKAGATVKPLAETDLTLSANYIASRIDLPVAGFPTATAELEAAFPDRFTRDADGRLTAIDNRPVNFERSDSSQLRWGFNLSLPIKASAAEIAAAEARREAFRRQRAAESGTAAPAAGAPAGAGAPAAAGGDAGARGPRAGGGGGGGGRGGGRFGGLGGADGRFQMSVFHTWRLEERVLIRAGVPQLDLLNGSATGSNGGQPRHEIEVRGGFGKSGLGARLSANWQSATRVLTDPSGGTTSPNDLFFSGLTTASLRLFADLGQRPELVRRAPWLRGARVTLAVNNITDARIDVRDRTGTVPINYQPFLIDPIGRSINLSLRKVFF